MRETVGGLSVALLVADAGIVDHRVVAARPVDLIGDENALGLRQRAARLNGARLVARMQRRLVSALDEPSRRHQAKAVGRAGDENARHGGLPGDGWGG